MASQSSFDISTGADLQEVDNAVNQARKELAQRYDFKGSKASIEFDKAKAQLVLIADDDFKMKALFDLLQGRLIKRGVPVKNLVIGAVLPAANSTVRREIGLTQGIAGDKAREIVKAVKEGGFKKVQSAIQGEEIRVSAPARDELQNVIAFLRSRDFGIELKFGNYRG
ncbi:MAG: YajQ family cyclic di-GMP-binding protein [Gemmatimonadales bacterium]